MYSLVVPVYNNEANLTRLLHDLVKLGSQVPADFERDFEVVFVVDGSPDRSFEILRETLPALPLRSRLISLSRNFGSFSAVAAGLEQAGGDHLAVVSADLQEPPELVTEFFRILRDEKADIVFGVRSRRSDPWFSEIASNVFWWIYRAFVIRDLPRGGVGVFACSREVRDRLLQLQEINTNLVALLFWLGYRREYVLYERRPRLEGRSAWNAGKKLRYCLNSIFNFTDLPIQLLLCSGFTALILGVLGSITPLSSRFCFSARSRVWDWASSANTSGSRCKTHGGGPIASCGTPSGTAQSVRGRRENRPWN